MTRIISNKNPRDMIIFALDIGVDIEEAVSWINLIEDHVKVFKIGKEAFTRYGPRIIEMIKERGKEVFLDMKFHDIPNTVAGAAVGAVKQGVFMFNVHALGGRQMMEEAVSAVDKVVEETGLPRPIVLAVTVLTSLNDSDLNQLGFNYPASELTLRLSRIAQDSGVTGVVASPRDIENIRAACGQDFIIVTPGIRDVLKSDDDQKRTATVRDAIMRGADYIVVGRPIRKAVNPVQKVEEIVNEITEGLALREKVV